MKLVSNIDSQPGDDNEIVFDERMDFGEGGEERKEQIKKALNDYINERLHAVSQDYKTSS